MAKRTPLQQAQDELEAASKAVRRHEEGLATAKAKAARAQKRIDWLRQEPTDDEDQGAASALVEDAPPFADAPTATDDPAAESEADGS